MADGDHRPSNTSDTRGSRAKSTQKSTTFISPSPSVNFARPAAGLSGPCPRRTPYFVDFLCDVIYILLFGQNKHLIQAYKFAQAARTMGYFEATWLVLSLRRWADASGVYRDFH